MSGSRVTARPNAVGAQVVGLLLLRRRGATVEFLLVHPGGPLRTDHDDGAWSIPAGQSATTDDRPGRPENRKSFAITGILQWSPDAKVIPILIEAHAEPVPTQQGAFSFEGSPGTGRFADLDRAAWFDVGVALRKIMPSQRPLIELACHMLAIDKSDMEIPPKRPEPRRKAAP